VIPREDVNIFIRGAALYRHVRQAPALLFAVIRIHAPYLFLVLEAALALERYQVEPVRKELLVLRRKVPNVLVEDQARNAAAGKK
jgi:hypothetical protein